MERSKNIVVITGSPRKNGNSFAMTDAFIAAARGKGHAVTRFDAADMDIKGCTACNTCYKNGAACSFGDDFNQVAAAIEAADAVVFATPLYWYTFPAGLKAVIDKLYALCVGKRDIQGKQCALMACCEEDDISAFEGMCFAYRHTTALLEWESLGEVLVCSVNAPGDINKTDGAARAVALAEEL